MFRICALILGLSLLAIVVQAEDSPPGKSLEFEVSVIHLRSSDSIAAEQRALTGAALQKAVADWRAAGKIERMTTMRMSALESQPASVQIGEMAAVVVGRSFAAGRGGFQGPAQYNTQMEQYGTMVECTGKVTAGDMIEVKVAAEQTRPGRAAAATAVRPTDAAGGATDAAAAQDASHPGRTITQARTVVIANSGECLVIGAAWNDGAEGTTATIVLLVPRLLAAPRK